MSPIRSRLAANKTRYAERSNLLPSPKPLLMPRFLKLDTLDPYELFASTMRTSRFAMRNTYAAAFDAHLRCSDLLRKHQWSQIDTDNVFEQIGLYDSGLPRRPGPSRAELDRMYAQAYAEDLQADHLAGVLLLFADDALQRFAKGVLGVAPGPSNGFGPQYGDHRGKVNLTTLLRAGTNAIRHVSEWDDYPWNTLHPRKVYPTLEECTNEKERRILENIVVFQKVLGYGIHERIRDVQSMRILIQIDGRFGTEDPDYDRFEEGVLAAAREIASASGPEALFCLQSALDFSAEEA